MGHLTRIANTVVHNLEKGPIHTQISNLISGVLEAHGNIIFALYLQMSPSHTHTHNVYVLLSFFLAVELPEDYRGRWETFVDQTLSETNRKNTIDLVKPSSHWPVIFVP